MLTLLTIQVAFRKFSFTLNLTLLDLPDVGSFQHRSFISIFLNLTHRNRLRSSRLQRGPGLRDRPCRGQQRLEEAVESVDRPMVPHIVGPNT